MQGQGSAQGDQQQGQRTLETTGGSNHSSTMEAADLNKIPTGMLYLFQQILETMSKKDQVHGDHNPEVKNDPKEKEIGEKQGHTKDIPKSSAQGEAREMTGNNDPYCYHFLTRGHPKEECVAVLFYDICESVAHIKGRCPLLKKTKSTNALTCGYTLDGLGFYYIPNMVAVRPKTVVKTSLVRVVEGTINAMQIRLELERLVPAKVNWEVEDIEKNIFKTAHRKVICFT
jgi:hypothetical protein